MQNFIINFMVEITISKNENSNDENLSWKDIQGLSWVFEGHRLESDDNLSTYACA